MISATPLDWLLRLRFLLYGFSVISSILWVVAFLPNAPSLTSARVSLILWPLIALALIPLWEFIVRRLRRGRTGTIVLTVLIVISVLGAIAMLPTIAFANYPPFDFVWAVLTYSAPSE